MSCRFMDNFDEIVFIDSARTLIKFFTISINLTKNWNIKNKVVTKNKLVKWFLPVNKTINEIISCLMNII